MYSSVRILSFTVFHFLLWHVRLLSEAWSAEWTKTWSNFGLGIGNNQLFKGTLSRKGDRMLFPKIRCLGLFKSHALQLRHGQIKCLTEATHVGDNIFCKEALWADISARPIIYVLLGTPWVIYKLVGNEWTLHQCLVTVLWSLGLGDDLGPRSRHGGLDRQDFSLKRTA